MAGIKKNTTGIKRHHPAEKEMLHARNRHRARYDFTVLRQSSPELGRYITVNAFGDESIDFADPEAVMALNKALLLHFYDITYWEIPKGYLCPPVPGRADYIHLISDLLAEKNRGQIPTGKGVSGLDIGTGANLIYPIIGVKEYGWHFTGSEMDGVALVHAQKIADQNTLLKNQVELRRQVIPQQIFRTIIQPGEAFDFVMCNPPFHASQAAADAAGLKKIKNLKAEKGISGTPKRNFGGQSHELWCAGGEEKFVYDMIVESASFGQQCFWFTTLISKQATLKSALGALKKAGVAESRVLPMGQGNKLGRVLAWTFLDVAAREAWVKKRWSEV